MFNSRHPDPRRVWKGGSELRFTTSLPVDPLDPVDPRMNSQPMIPFGAVLKKSIGWRSGAFFLLTAPSKKPTRETFFGQMPSEMLSKSVVLREAVLRKSKKRRAIALAARHPSLTAVSQRLPEINMLKMGAIPGKDYHTGPTAPILSMLISCMSQRLRYGLTAPRDYAYISPKTPIVHLTK